MLRRRSSKNRHRRPLGRSKSTGSIARKRFYDLHRDPQVAERDAHIAARLSYQRAQGNTSARMSALRFSSASPEPERGDSRISRRDFAQSDGTCQPAGSCYETSAVSRQQSIRFTRQGTISRKTLSSRGSEQRLSTGNSDYDGPLSGKATHKAQMTLSEGAESSLYSAPPPPGMRPAALEDATSEKSSVLVPSLNHKLRKSRSMFNSSDHTQSMPLYNDNPGKRKDNIQPSRYASLNKENTPLDRPKLPAGLRAPKSMTFLQNRGRQTVSQMSSQAERDLAVQLARDKFRQQVQQPRLKSHSSTFFMSRSRRTDSSLGLRKSFRDSSNTSAGLSSAFSGDSLSIPKQGSLRKTARKVSRSLKTKLKGLFGRQRSSETSNHPSDAPTTTQDSDDNDAYLRLGRQFEDQEASMSRGPSRIASLHAVSSCQQIQSRQGSIDSCDGEVVHTPDDKSRVTSWTDSVTNTVNSIPPSGDWERQRLSVIKENVTHASSLSPAQPRPSADFAIGTALNVDSQRVYSALMKRADEIKKKEGEARTQTVEEMTSKGRAPPRSSSMDQIASSEWSPPTIRCVQPEDDVFQDSVEDFTATATLSNTNANARCSGPTATTPRYGSPNPWVGGDQSKASTTEQKAVSTQAPTDRGKSLAQRSSAFFASPSNHLFRTASPYRRALQENMQASVAGDQGTEAPGKWQAKYLGSLSAVSLPKRCPSTGESGRNTPKSCAESMYSSTEDPEGPDASLVERFPRPPVAYSHGTATMVVKPEKDVLRCQPVRDVSTASSFEWKTWLSSHVAKLETSETPHTDDAGSHSPGILPSLGHVRERAEINSTADLDASPKAIELATGVNDLEANDRSPKGDNLHHSTVSRRSQNTSNEWHQPWKDDGTTPEIIYRSTRKPSLRTYPSLPVLPSARDGSMARGNGACLPHATSSNTVSHISPSSQREEKWQKRRARYLDSDAVSSPRSSPGLTAALQGQFGPKGEAARPRQPNPLSGSFGEQLEERSTNEAESMKANPTSAELEAQQVGSKRMVDLFLNSRRRGTYEGHTNGRSEKSPAAFL